MKIRPFYAYFVAHVLHNYFSDRKPAHPSTAFTRDMESVGKVMASMSPAERQLARELYKDSTADFSAKITAASLRRNMKASEMWNFVSNLERRVALERGLI